MMWKNFQLTAKFNLQLKNVKISKFPTLIIEAVPP